jgi:hypothetical protein
MRSEEISMNTGDVFDRASQASSEPNKFQQFAGDLWGGPPGGSGNGGTMLEFASFKHKGGNGGNGGGQDHQAGRLPEIDGVQSHLEGLVDNKTELTLDATVVKTVPDSCNPRNGLSHEMAVLQDASGEYIWWAHDLNFADRVPVKVGDKLELKGEWIPTPEHEQHEGFDTVGVIHWTHDGEADADHPNRHQSGYVELNGVQYHNRADGPADSCSRN